VVVPLVLSRGVDDECFAVLTAIGWICDYKSVAPRPITALGAANCCGRSLPAWMQQFKQLLAQLAGPTARPPWLAPLACPCAGTFAAW